MFNIKNCMYFNNGNIQIHEGKFTNDKKSPEK
jgi:hypothetical protein